MISYIASLAISAAGGSFIKLIASLVGGLIDKWQDSNRADQEFKLAALGKKTEYLQVSQGGKDNANTISQIVRSVIALSFSTIICVAVLVSIFDPAFGFNITVDQTPGIFGWLFGSTSKGVIEVSRGEFLFAFLNLFTAIISFYFTKVRYRK